VTGEGWKNWLTDEGISGGGIVTSTDYLDNWDSPPPDWPDAPVIDPPPPVGYGMSVQGHIVTNECAVANWARQDGFEYW
jgi:hypothetical protein